MGTGAHGRPRKGKTMPRYIDADALQLQLQKKKPGAANGRYTDGFNDALLRFKSMVHSAKTIDVVPVVRGECNHCKEDSCELCFNAGYYIICEDGMNETCEYFQKMNYCPNCGAKMEVEP